MARPPKPAARTMTNVMAVLTGTGRSITIVIFPGLTSRERFGMISLAPMMEIGTMGTPAWMAR